MSKQNSSLALEEMKRSESDLDSFHERHLSICDSSTETQLVNQVVKVRGSITVSF